MKPVLSLREVSKSYRRGQEIVSAVSGVSFELDRGDIAAIAGPSGSGKTTLLNLIGTLDRPDAGVIFLDGRCVGGLKPSEADALRREHIGFIFQDFSLLPVLSAVENVEMALVMTVRSRSDRRNRAAEMLVSVGLEDRMDHRPNELSGGQQQRVAIARALVTKPLLVLGDEPTGNLDGASTRQLLEIVQRLNRELGTTFLFSTHDPRVLENTRLVFRLQDGRLQT